MLLEYSIIMTSSNTINKGEEWVWWNSIQMVNQLIHLYQIFFLSLAVQGVQVKVL